MDFTPFLVIAFMLLGAAVLALIYMASRAGAYDGNRDFENDKRRLRK